MTTTFSRPQRADLLISLLVILILAVFYFIIAPPWIILHPHGSWGFSTYSDYFVPATCIAAGLIAIWSAYTLSGRERTAWASIGAGVVSWGLGMSIWAFYRNVLERPVPFPSLADLGFLMFIPLMLVGLVIIPAGTIRPEQRLKLGLDALIAIAAIATVAWYFLLEPIYTGTQGGLLLKLIGVAYPAGDVLLLSAIVGAITRGWIQLRNPSLIALMLGIVAFLIADVGFMYLTLHGIWDNSHPTGLGWVWGCTLIAYASITYQQRSLNSEKG